AAEAKGQRCAAADKPGIWMMHCCHNTYHQEAGMMTSLNYVT
ncbi:MAG: multicopper oxidase, type 2, partial [Mycobacterium sp.]|nr:multicopper oxidase, type 2 [Mycobacterium sp.]